MKIVIVEDLVLMAEFLGIYCRKILGHDVTGVAFDGASGLELILTRNPELAILDLELPGLSGTEVIRELRRQRCRCKLLVLTAYCDAYTVYRLEHCQVDAFLMKGVDPPAVLGEAVSALAEGRRYFSRRFQAEVTRRKRDAQSFDKILGQREVEILVLVGDGWSDAEIAARCRISRRTVESHRFHIARKLDLKTRAELLWFARRNGFTAKR